MRPESGVRTASNAVDSAGELAPEVLTDYLSEEIFECFEPRTQAFLEQLNTHGLVVPTREPESTTR